MNLPKIDLSSLPDLEQMTGLFGSLSNLTQVQSDDRIIILMVFMYELIP